MDTNQLMALGLVVPVIVALVFAALPYLNGSIRGERRREALLTGAMRGKNTVNDRAAELANRRKQITDSLKEIDAKANNNKKLSLEVSNIAGRS